MEEEVVRGSSILEQWERSSVSMGLHRLPLLAILRGLGYSLCLLLFSLPLIV